MLDQDVTKYLDESILCWLATSSNDNQPNVSPKEIFFVLNDHQLVIANIASPGSEKNIKINENVAVSFVNILVQKGNQLKGQAKLINKGDYEFSDLNFKAEKLTLGKFPIKNFFLINVSEKKLIMAPSYLFYQDINEELMFSAAKKQYNLD